MRYELKKQIKDNEVIANASVNTLDFIFENEIKKYVQIGIHLIIFFDYVIIIF